MEKFKRINTIFKDAGIAFNYEMEQIFTTDKIRKYLFEFYETLQEWERMGRLDREPDYIIGRFINAYVEIQGYEHNWRKRHNFPPKFKLLQNFALDNKSGTFKEYCFVKYGYNIETDEYISES